MYPSRLPRPLLNVRANPWRCSNDGADHCALDEAVGALLIGSEGNIIVPHAHHRLRGYGGSPAGESSLDRRCGCDCKANLALSVIQEKYASK